MSEVERIIKQLNLEPHPEGGFYRRLYRSNIIVDCPATHGGPRTALTTIYYLVTNKEFSACHKLRSDEVWYFHAGSPLILYNLTPAGQLTEHRLDPATLTFQVTVKAGTWFCAKPSDDTSYSLISAAVGPGFEVEDFKLGTAKELLAEFPQHAELIKQFTR